VAASAAIGTGTVTPTAVDGRPAATMLVAASATTQTMAITGGISASVVSETLATDVPLSGI